MKDEKFEINRILPDGRRSCFTVELNWNEKQILKDFNVDFIRRGDLQINVLNDKNWKITRYDKKEIKMDSLKIRKEDAFTLACLLLQMILETDKPKK